jgi:hypothetical protein
MQKKWWGLGALAALSASTIMQRGDLFQQIRPTKAGDIFERNVGETTGDMFGRRAGSRDDRGETSATLIAALKDQAKSQQPAAADPSEWFDTKSREYTIRSGTWLPRRRKTIVA